jgi:hypothetical protein
MPESSELLSDKQQESSSLNLPIGGRVGVTLSSPEYDSDTLIVPGAKFLEAYNLDVRDFVERDYNGVRYMSWSYAWYLLKQYFPNYYVSLEKPLSDEGIDYFPTPGGAVLRPFVVDAMTGKRTQALYYPVQDSRHKSVATPDTMTLNKNIQRAYTKAIACYCGIGLRLYTGEDLENTEKHSYLDRIRELAEEYRELYGVYPEQYDQIHLGLTIPQLTTIGKAISEKVKEKTAPGVAKSTTNKK